MKEYTHCYFAFLDLLGFKEIVRTKTCSEIADIFEEAKKRFCIREIIDKDKTVPLVPPEDIHYYIMSDSICVYIKDTVKSALSVLMWICLDFQVRMLCLETPIFVRGSISQGDVFEDQNVLFGPGMVEAYLRAEKLARVPRIIIPANIYDQTIDRTDKAFLDVLTHPEQDGFHVLNYINFFCTAKSTLKYRENVNNYISNALNTSLDQSIREKFLYAKTWMEYYYNQEEAKTNEQ